MGLNINIVRGKKREWVSLGGWLYVCGWGGGGASWHWWGHSVEEEEKEAIIVRKWWSVTPQLEQQTEEMSHPDELSTPRHTFIIYISTMPLAHIVWQMYFYSNRQECGLFLLIRSDIKNSAVSDTSLKEQCDVLYGNQIHSTSVQRVYPRIITPWW